MVLTGRGHRAFDFAGCGAGCCAPGARQVVTTQQRPLLASQKIAFIFAVNKCFGKLPVEVLDRIFDLSVTVERKVVVQHKAPVSRSRFHDPLAKFGELSMDSPAI